MDCSMPRCPVFHRLPELAQTHVHLILCHPLLLLLFIFPSIRVFFSELALQIRWPKYWSFSISISPSNEHSELISFRMDWFEILAIHGAFKSLLQHHSSKASILWSQPSLWSNSHIHTWLLEKPKLWLYRPLSAKLSLLFNTLSRFVIAFLPRSKHLLISWLQSSSAVILEPKKKVCYCFYCFPIYLPWSDGSHDPSFLNVEF